MRMLSRSVLLCAGGIALAACSSSVTKRMDDVNPNVVPTNYRNEILDTLASSLDDPTNVREAGISEPFLMTIAGEQRYAVCMKFNARDINRRYLGVKTRVAFFFAGHLNQLVEASGEQCAKAVYKPFPELEKFCLGNKCN